MTNAQMEAIASKLNVTLEVATSLVKQEQARSEAGRKYRTSEAYKLRLAQQKAVRAALKQIQA